MENKEKKYNNVKAITRLQRPDGMPSAIIVAQNLMVNNEPSINPTKNGKIAISFPTNLAVDDFTKSRLSHSLNGMVLNETQFGISTKVVTFVKAGARYDQLAENLVKGAKITLTQGTLSPKNYFNDKNEIVSYLELWVDPFNFGYIVSPEEAKAKKSETGQAASQVASRSTSANYDLHESDLPF